MKNPPLPRPFDLVCLGRAAVDLYGEQIGGRLEDMQTFNKYLGGSPANTAVGLARLGLKPAMLTRVGDEHNGRFVRETLAAEGVDVSHVVRGGDRLGIYFAETGASQRASTVIYDRAASAIAGMQPGTIDWARVMEGARWFHVTGITPALGSSAAAFTREALAAARAAGATVSMELNYR